MRETASTADRRRLWNGRFLLLLIGCGLSAAGDGVYLIGLGWWVLEQTGSPSALATVQIVTMLAVLSTGFWAGVLIDRGNLLKLLLIADVWRALVLSGLLIIALVGITVSLPVLCVTGFLLGVGSGIAKPGVFTLIPQLVDESDVRRAISAFDTVRMTAMLGGPALGGTVIALFGVEGTIALDTLSFIASAVTMVVLRRTILDKVAVPNRSNGPVRLRDGIRIVLRSRPAIASVAVISVGNATLAMYVLAAPFASATSATRPEDGALVYGIAQSSFQAGMGMTSALLMSRRGSRIPARTWVVGSSLAVLALGQFGAGEGNPVVLVVAAFSIGVGITLATVLAEGRLQTAIPPSALGRAQGLATSVSTALRPLGTGMAGLLANAGGPEAALICAALVTSVLAVAITVARPYSPDRE